LDSFELKYDECKKNIHLKDCVIKLTKFFNAVFCE
jgi:hypothetical protein